MAYIDLKHKSVNEDALIGYWRENPVQAAMDIYGCNGEESFDLSGAQKMVLDSRWTHQYELDLFTRGGGKTFMNAVTAGLIGMLYPGQRVGLIAPSFRQSKMMFAELQKLKEISPMFADSIQDGPSITPEKCYIKFKAAPGKIGSVIEALPLGTDGAKIRGARYFTVFADELAQIPEEVLDVVVGGFLATHQNPMQRVKLVARLKEQLAAGLITEEDAKRALGTGNRFIGSSTAYYQYNYMWERVSRLIDEIWGKKQMLGRKGEDHSHLIAEGGAINGGQIPARYLSDGKQALCVFPFWDLDEGFSDLDSIARQQRQMSHYKFLMEYACFFPPDSEGFFRRELLNAARKHNRFGCAILPNPGSEYAMGIDPARNGDNFAASLFEIDHTLRIVKLVRIFTWHNRPFPEVHLKLRDIIRTFNVQRIKMDAGGGGTTIRDLFATPDLVPAGDTLILEQDNTDQFGLDGKSILAPLVQFSKYEWVKDANEGLKSALEHGRMQIAADSPVPGVIWIPEMDKVDEELESALVEMSSVVIKPSANRINWDTPTKNQRKDRYSAILLGYDAAKDMVNFNSGGLELATGGWG